MQSIKKISMWEVLPTIALSEDGTLYILRGHRLQFQKKYCISLKINFV